MMVPKVGEAETGEDEVKDGEDNGDDENNL